MLVMLFFLFCVWFNFGRIFRKLFCFWNGWWILLICFRNWSAIVKIFLCLKLLVKWSLKMLVFGLKNRGYYSWIILICFFFWVFLWFWLGRVVLVKVFWLNCFFDCMNLKGGGFWLMVLILVKWNFIFFVVRWG